MLYAAVDKPPRTTLHLTQYTTLVAFDAPSGVPTNPQSPAPIDAPDEGLETGTVIGNRYEVLGRLGAGGMGRVFRVHDRDLNEDIALKVVSVKDAGDPRAFDQLREEVKAARKIAHKNICKVFDYGDADGLQFLTMELIEGRSLRAVLRDGPIPRDRVVEIVGQISAGLSAVHDAGMVHRDLKPDNVVLRQNGEAVLVDFGLARSKILDDPRKNIAGTPAYMSPEQLRGEKLDERSDIFALGVLSYELLTGRAPFDRESSATTIEAILHESPPDFESWIFSKVVEANVRSVLQQALAKSPAHRFSSALDFANSFAQAFPHQTSQEIAPALTPAFPRASRRMWSKRLFRNIILGLLVAAGMSAFVWIRFRPKHLPLRPVVLMAPFENVTHDAAYDGLSRSATEAARTSLQRLAGIDLQPVQNENEARAALADGRANWILVGKLDSASHRLDAHFERSGRWGTQSEAIEIDWRVADDMGEPLQRVRERVLDEARILYQEHNRHREAEGGTTSKVAHEKLVRYYNDYYVSIVQGANEEVANPAQRLLDDAIVADEKYVPAYVERAYLQATKGTREQIDLARKDAQRAVAIAPNNVAALIMRCRVLQVSVAKTESPSNGEVAAAMDACKAAIESAPDSAETHIVFARLHNLQCRDEEAMNSLEKARKEERAQTGRALAHYVHLAFDGEYWDRAERASVELLGFEEEQREARKSILTRLGIPPEREAPFLRAVALMHDEKWPEAQAELEKQLKWLADESPDPILEAVTMRGLLYRIPNPSAQTKNKYTRSLEEREKTIHDEIARDPLTAIDVAGYYQWIDPAKAVEWIELAKASTSSTEAFSCNASLRIASIYRAAGKLDEARAAAAQCKPHADRDWEKSCLVWVKKRLSQ